MGSGGNGVKGFFVSPLDGLLLGEEDALRRRIVMPKLLYHARNATDVDQAQPLLELLHAVFRLLACPLRWNLENVTHGASKYTDNGNAESSIVRTK